MSALVSAPVLAGDASPPHVSPLKKGRAPALAQGELCTAPARSHGALEAPARAQAMRCACENYGQNYGQNFCQNFGQTLREGAGCF